MNRLPGKWLLIALMAGIVSAWCWAAHVALVQDFPRQTWNYSNGQEATGPIDLDWTSDIDLAGTINVANAGNYYFSFYHPYLQHPLPIKGVEINGRYHGGEEISPRGEHQRVRLWLPGDGLQNGSNEFRVRFGSTEAASLIEKVRMSDAHEGQLIGSVWLLPREQAIRKTTDESHFSIIAALAITVTLSLMFTWWWVRHLPWNTPFGALIATTFLIVPVTQLCMYLGGFTILADSVTIGCIGLIHTLFPVSAGLIRLAHDRGMFAPSGPLSNATDSITNLFLRARTYLYSWFHSPNPQSLAPNLQSLSTNHQRGPSWLMQGLIWAAFCFIPDIALLAKGSIPLVGDTITSNLPLKTMAMEQMKEGRLPLWGSELGCGIPLLADTISLPFDPRNLWFLVLSPIPAYWMMLLTSRLIGGWICLAYFRMRHGLSFGAALAATAVYFCGTVLIYENRLHSTCVILEGFPAIIWLTERLLQKASLGRGLALALGWTILFYMGSIAYLIYLPVLALVWAIALSWFSRPRIVISSFLKFGFMYAAAIVWAACLCGATLLPFVELTSLSNRGGEYPRDPFAFRSVFFGLIGAHQPSNLVPGFNAFFYVGVVSIPLILSVLSERRNAYLRMAAPLAGISLLGLILTTSPLKPWLVSFMPIFATVAFFRLSFFWGLLAAVMVGHALQQPGWLGRLPGRATAWSGNLLYGLQIMAMALVPILFLWFMVLYGDDHERAGQFFSTMAPILKETFLAILLFRVIGMRLLRKAMKTPRPRLAGVGLCLLAELLVAYTLLRPRSEPGSPPPYVVTPEVAFLKKNHSTDYRIAEVLSPSSEATDLTLTMDGYRSLALDAPPMHGLHTANVYESLILDGFAQVWREFDDIDVRKDHYARATNAVMATSVSDSPLYDALGVKFLLTRHQPFGDPNLELRLSGESFHVYERMNARPRAYFHAGEGITPARIVRDDDSEVEVEVICPSEGHIVLSDTHCPGWKVWVDGEESVIEEANGFAKEVPVGAGAHRLIFRYEPASFVWGLRLTVISGVITIILGGWLALSSRGKQETDGATHLPAHRRAA